MNEIVNNQIRKNITNNKTYREFLKTNTTMLIKINHQNTLHENPQIRPTPRKNTFPYLFRGIYDNSQPHGYENSLPKQMYISQEQVESSKKRIFTTL